MKSAVCLRRYGDFIHNNRITDSWDWLSGRKNLPEILLGYHQHCGSYYKHSHCNLFWRLDKICYFYKSHYTIITGACGLYWNQMLCERLDGRTRILLKKQGVYDILNLSFAMQVQMKMLACGNHDNFTRNLQVPLNAVSGL